MTANDNDQHDEYFNVTEHGVGDVMEGLKKAQAGRLDKFMADVKALGAEERNELMFRMLMEVSNQQVEHSEAIDKIMETFGELQIQFAYIIGQLGNLTKVQHH